MTVPNWVTLSRLLGLPDPVLLETQPLKAGSALASFIAAITDWVDGYLARKLNQVTELGKFLDLW